MRFSSAIAFAFCLSSSALAQTAMTGAQLKSDFVGRTFKLDWTDGKHKNSGRQTLAADGSATLKMNNGDTDKGTWSIKGDKLCTKWKKSPGDCSRIYSLGGGKYLWEGKGRTHTVFY